MANRQEILAKIKEFIEGNPFLNEKLYKKFQGLNDEHLGKALIILYRLEERRKKLGKDGDKKIIKAYQKIEEDFKKMIEKE